MRRWAAASILLLLPGFVLSLLLALGERDWFHCFAHAEFADPPPLAPLFAPGELTPVLLETLTPPFSGPAMMLWHFGPGAFFAVLYLSTRNAPRQRAALAGAALYLGALTVVLLPVARQHGCGSAGPDSAINLPFFHAAGRRHRAGRRQTLLPDRRHAP